MIGNPADEWKALTENYRSMSDGQLCELAADFTDLTPTAQQVLRDELKLRKLGDPLSPDWARSAAQTPDADGAAGDQRPVEYTWKTLLRECDSPEEAWQISEVLRRAGIESWREGPGRYSPYRDLDLRGSRVLVAADQLEEAKAIVSHPIPPEIVEASQPTDEDIYELPVCPKCGAADPVLEAVDPVNKWLCESCGAEWADEAAPA
jgi:hypothetical protein